MGSHLEDDSSFISNIPVAMDITVAVVYSVFGVCSLFGNSMLLYVSYKKKHLLKPPEYFIVNLAVSDLGLTLSLYPMAISSSLYHRWLYGKTVCYLYAFCGMLFGICSLTTLTLLSMVCFVKVCHPLYGNRFNSWHGRGLMGCAWAYALLFASAPLARWGEYGPEPYGTACCIDWRRSNQHTQARSYTVALFLFCYILPCCAIVTSYWAIMARLRDSQRTMERHSARPSPHMSSLQAVIVKLSVAICMGFFAAWSPYAIVSMWAAFGHVDAIPPLAFALPAMLAKSSTIYNPAIYLMLRPNFRRVLRRDLVVAVVMLLFPCLCRHTLQSGSHILFSKGKYMPQIQPNLFFLLKVLHFDLLLMYLKSYCLHLATTLYTDGTYIMFLMLCGYVGCFCVVLSLYCLFFLQLNMRMSQLILQL
uniref:G-protein coupled receptors family 1 profile domain-containing protein n=1 Tax=Gadus morhua TaxID=8049 RepID=A0A8C5FKD4_GADMO